jgi:hypothetical protein
MFILMQRITFADGHSHSVTRRTNVPHTIKNVFLTSEYLTVAIVNNTSTTYSRNLCQTLADCMPNAVTVYTTYGNQRLEAETNQPTKKLSKG